MTTHISQSTCSELPPTAPVKGNEIIDIICLLRRSQPQIPVKFLRYGWMLSGPEDTLQPNRTDGPVMHFFNIANNLCFTSFPHVSHARKGSTLVTHLGNHFIFFL